MPIMPRPPDIRERYATQHQKISQPGRIGTKQKVGHEHDEHGQEGHRPSCGPYQHQNQARHDAAVKSNARHAASPIVAIAMSAEWM